MKREAYFKELNIPAVRSFPFFGNFFDIKNKGYRNFETRLVTEFGPIVGYYEGSEPIVVCTDKALIKNICIKDFSSFTNRRARIYFIYNGI